MTCPLTSVPICLYVPQRVFAQLGGYEHHPSRAGRWQTTILGGSEKAVPRLLNTAEAEGIMGRALSAKEGSALSKNSPEKEVR